MAKKKLILISLLLLTLVCSCTSKKGDSKLSSAEGMNPNQQKAREVVSQDVQHLNNSQYGISDEDVALLKAEGLLTEKDLNSLKIVK